MSGTGRLKVKANGLAAKALERCRSRLDISIHLGARGKFLYAFHINAVQVRGLHLGVRSDQRTLLEHGHQLFAVVFGCACEGFEFLSVEFSLVVPRFNLGAFQILHGNLGAADCSRISFAFAHVGDFERFVHLTAKHGLGSFDVVALQAHTVDSGNHVTGLELGFGSRGTRNNFGHLDTVANLINGHTNTAEFFIGHNRSSKHCCNKRSLDKLVHEILLENLSALNIYYLIVSATPFV